MRKSFTQLLREEVAREVAEAERYKGVVEEWQAAVERLYDTMRGWLAESDPDHIIQIAQKPHEMRENGLGTYQIPRLELRAFGRRVGIVPKARLTVASAQLPLKSTLERAKGRVDISDDVRRYVLLRFFDESGGDLWLIDDMISDPVPLHPQAFETSLMGFLL